MSPISQLREKLRAETERLETVGFLVWKKHVEALDIAIEALEKHAPIAHNAVRDLWIEEALEQVALRLKDL